MHPFQSRIPSPLHKWLKVAAAEEGISLKHLSSRILGHFVMAEPWNDEKFIFHRCVDADSSILFFFPDEDLSFRIRDECEIRGTSISAFVYTATEWYAKLNADQAKTQKE